MLEHDKEQAALEKIHADISRIYAEQRKLTAETHKITRENFWYPMGVVMAMFTVLALYWPSCRNYSPSQCAFRACHKQKTPLTQGRESGVFVYAACLTTACPGCHAG